MAEPLPDISQFINGNPNDIIEVTNPDLSCSDEEVEFLKDGNVRSFLHTDYFEVKWDGRPHRIVPGQTRNFPRWLAKHYAKHLTDHILTKRSLPINHATERIRVLNSIFVKVVELFEEPEDLTQGQIVGREVDDLNTPPPGPNIPFSNGQGRSQELHEADLGSIPDPTIGVLKNPPKDITEVMKEAGNLDEIPSDLAMPKGTDDAKPRPTRGELFKEADKLGIEVSGKENVDQLMEMISKF